MMALPRALARRLEGPEQTPQGLGDLSKRIELREIVVAYANTIWSSSPNW